MNRGHPIRQKQRLAHVVETVAASWSWDVDICMLVRREFQGGRWYVCKRGTVSCQPKRSSVQGGLGCECPLTPAGSPRAAREEERGLMTSNDNNEHPRLVFRVLGGRAPQPALFPLTTIFFATYSLHPQSGHETHISGRYSAYKFRYTYKPSTEFILPK